MFLGLLFLNAIGWGFIISMLHARNYSPVVAREHPEFAVLGGALITALLNWGDILPWNLIFGGGLALIGWVLYAEGSEILCRRSNAYYPPVGERLAWTIQNAFEKANWTGFPVTVKFNGDELTAEPGGRADYLVAEHLDFRLIDSLLMRTFEPIPGSTISEAAKTMVEWANVIKESVVTDFNKIHLIANPGDDPESLVEQYRKEIKRQHDEHVNSPEYKERQREYEEKARRDALILEEALASAPEKMTLKDEQVWQEAVEKNTDPYGSCVIRYTERWARLMEGRIASGESIQSCAKETSSIANNEGITGFQYGCAVSMLSSMWIHGDELRQWHNLDVQLGS